MLHVFPTVLILPALRSSNNYPTGNMNNTVIISKTHRITLGVLFYSVGTKRLNTSVLTL
jgi:hypothetical protein